MKTWFSQLKIPIATEPCDFCGTIVPTKSLVVIEINESKNIHTCPNCYNLIGTCRTCKHILRCGFEEDITEPHQVQKTIRQGPMIMNTIIKNPNLIEKHCSSCYCSNNNWNGNENGGYICQRENEIGMNCANYEFAEIT